MKKFRFGIAVITVVCLLFSTLTIFGAVAGENTTNNENLGVFAELEYKVLANTVTIFGQAPTAEETEITVWIKEDGTNKNIVIRQFKSNDDGSFERKFMLNTALYDADNTATMRIGATNTNTQTITGIALYSQEEIAGCVSDFGSITDKSSIGSFFEAYSDILDLNDEEGNSPTYTDEELEVLYEIYTLGDYNATDTDSVLEAISDIVNKFTRREDLMAELNVAADNGDGEEVRRLLTSKYASILTFEITTAKLIKVEEMWLRMTESTLTDSLGNVLGSEKNYQTMNDIKTAYEDAYVAQYDCDSRTGGLATTDRTYNFVEFDENGDGAWKLSYAANIVIVSGRHEVQKRTNVAIHVTDATTDSITILMQQAKTDSDGNFTVSLPLNTERFGDETVAIIRIGALDTNVWQFFVPVFPQNIIDEMVEAFKEIGSVEDFEAFLVDYYEVLRMGADFSDHKIQVMYSLYTEQDYSVITDGYAIADAINELSARTTDVLTFIDEVNDASAAKRWGTMQSVIETKYAYLAESITVYRELLEAIDHADIKSFKGLYNKMTGKTYTTIEDVKEAFEEAYEEQYEYENQPKKENGGGSGGGGGGGVSFGGNTNPGSSNESAVPENKTPSGSKIPGTVDPEKLPVAPFTDVTDTYSWAATAIDGLRNSAIILGDGNGTFRPGDNMTREEYLTILLKTYGIEAQAGYVSFTDVDQNAWYADVVATAYEMGITNGMGNSIFGIGQKITRTDAVVLAARTAEKMGVFFPQKEKAKIFDDHIDIPEYGYEYIVAFQQADFINGDTSGKFNPLNPVTRAEAAVIFWNIFSYVD